MRISLGQARGPIARAMGECATAARVVDTINEATEALMVKGKWKTTVARWRVCVTNSCITWPREMGTIEAMAICGCGSGKVRSSWYEFLGDGPGLMETSSDIGAQIIDRGYSIAFDEVVGLNKKLAVYCQGPETTNTSIVLKYRNSSGQKVYSQPGGLGADVIEGESITLPGVGGYQYSTYTVFPAGFYDVVKPVTSYPIRILEYDTATNTYRDLAYYEPSETVPLYRSSFIGNIAGWGEEDCSSTAVTVMGKKQFIPVQHDTDIIQIPSLRAIRLGCQAVDKERKNLQVEAVQYWALAQQAVDEQLKDAQGDGVEQPIRLLGNHITGPAVFNMV